MFEEKNKAQRLQTELDVSEQVQRDFVKLSQTLQVRCLGNHHGPSVGGGTNVAGGLGSPLSLPLDLCMITKARNLVFSTDLGPFSFPFYLQRIIRLSDTGGAEGYQSVI